MKRCQKVHLNGNISNPHNINRGVRLGSRLGYLLFCMFINSPADVLIDCRVHMYANDVKLCNSTRKENIVYTQLTVIWIELTVEFWQMIYALILESPNVLCF